MKVLKILALVVLCFSTLVYAEDLKTKIEAVPKVYTVTPPNSATLGQARYPVFDNYSGEAACGETLAGLSGTLKPGQGSFVPVPGMILEGDIPDAYRHGSAMIVWTIRVEGSNPSPETIWSRRGGLCSRFHGSVDQIFKGGLVQTKAYISTTGPHSGFRELGSASSMTLPDGGSSTTVVTRDPTHSGSYVLKALDFPGGVLPAHVWIKIYWKNDTCLNLYSKAEYRSLMVTLLPTYTEYTDPY